MLEMPGGRSHHSIVSFYEIYEVDSQFQLVMEYVDGKNAHDWVAGLEGPLPIASAASIGRHLLQALEFAHMRGYVHRDVKPSNLLIFGPVHRPRARGEADRPSGLASSPRPKVTTVTRGDRRLNRLHLSRSTSVSSTNCEPRISATPMRATVLSLDRQVPLSRLRPSPAGFVPDDPPAPPPAPASLPARRARGDGADSLEGLAKTAERPLEIGRGDGQRAPRLRCTIERVNGMIEVVL